MIALTGGRLAGMRAVPTFSLCCGLKKMVLVQCHVHSKDLTYPGTQDVYREDQMAWP